MSYNGHEHLIVDVRINSPADEAGIKPGDSLIAINGKEIEDVLDFHFWETDESLTLTIKHSDSSVEDFEIEKDEEDELGLEFQDSLMDNYKSCRNKCIFCFIDQNPHGMRDTIYFKDDDSRLSFLQGNYVTLTNLKDKDIERICYYHLSPINISVHTTNPELRCKMLNNRFAGDSLRHLKTLKAGDITMNGQIVLCKGYNDGEELERTIHDLTEFIPNMQSLSVVPVGITKYREGLARLEEFNSDDAKKVINQINKWQGICLQYFGQRFVYASDEWYIKAGLPFPKEDDYDGYPQIENGVGMLRSLIDEVEAELEERTGDERVRSLSIATGKLAYPYIKDLAESVCKKYKNININIYEIINHFFGESITVAGLLTGGDIIKQLRGKPLGECLLLPANLLRSGEDVLLDDVTLEEIENALQTKIRIVKLNGWSFVDSIID
jgi:putative radical SAM enzyme (TIGR03279 family)